MKQLRRLEPDTRTLQPDASVQVIACRKSQPRQVLKCFLSVGERSGHNEHFEATRVREVDRAARLPVLHPDLFMRAIEQDYG